MGEFIKKLYLKWWIWPLPLIVLQIIQHFLIRKSFNASMVISDGIPKIVNFQDVITKISIILLIANVCMWFYYIIRKHRKAILGHLAMMGGALALCFGNFIGI